MDTSTDNAAGQTSSEHKPHSPSISASHPKSIWRNRDFVLLWSGQITSILGSQMAGLAYPLLVLALTHSPAKAGLIPVFWVLPFILFGLPAGALVDRWNRKRVMIVCDTIRMVGVFSVPVCYYFGHLSLLGIYAAALAEGLGFCFFNIAEISALPQVVAKDQLAQATSTNEAGYAATMTVGPGLAGAIIGAMPTQIAGAVVAFLVDGVSYMASLVGLSMIRTPFQQLRKTDSQTSLWEDITEGLRFIWGHERVRIVAFWSAWMALIYGPFQLSLILMVRHVFHHGAGTIGLLFSIGGIGGLVGAALAPHVKQKLSYGTVLMTVILVQGTATAIASIAPNLAVLYAMMFLIMGMNPIWNVTQMPYRLSVTPDHLQGRVNSCYRLLIFAAFPLGSAFGGLLLEHLSPRLLIGAMSAGALASVAVISTTKVRTA